MTQVPFNTTQTHRFKLVLARFPSIAFHMKTVSIPGLSLSEANVPTPFYNIPEPGDHISFQPLSIEFMVDENFQNYDEVVKWMIGLSTSFEKYSALSNNTIPTENTVSDGTLIILSNKLNSRIEFSFSDMWPTDIGDISFTHDNSDAEYATCQVTFKYTDFTYNILP